MRESTIKNYIIINENGKKYLYGEVFNDTRFPNGHIILTTEIVEEDKDNNVMFTENKTKYVLEQELTEKEFIEYVKKKYSEKITDENELKEYLSFILRPLKRNL